MDIETRSRTANMSTVNVASQYKPEPFHGNAGDNPADWVRRVKAYATALALFDDQIAQLVPLMLQGKAWGWYQTLPADIRKSWSKVSSALIEKFKPDKLQYLSVTEFYSRRQKKGKSAEDYIEWMAKRASDLAVSDSVATVSVVIQGLLPSFKAFVLSRSPTTPDQVREYYQVAEIVAKSSAVASVFALATDACATSQPSHGALSEVKTLHADKKSVLEAVRSIAAINPATDSRDRQRDQQRYTDKTCLKCGNHGHPQRDCALNTRPFRQQQKGRGPPALLGRNGPGGRGRRNDDREHRNCQPPFYYQGPHHEGGLPPPSPSWHPHITSHYTPVHGPPHTQYYTNTAQSSPTFQNGPHTAGPHSHHQYTDTPHRYQGQYPPHVGQPGAWYPAQKN